MSELKMRDFNYFQFLSHFYFILLIYFLFGDLGLGFNTVTQSHVMIENGRRFWKK